MDGEQESADIGREDRGRGRWWSRKRVEGSQSREAEDGAGIRRPREARRGDDEEAAGGRITGKTEWVEDEAREREREIRGEAVESQSLLPSPPLLLTLESIVSGGGVSLSSFTELAAGTARRWERRE